MFATLHYSPPGLALPSRRSSKYIKRKSDLYLQVVKTAERQEGSELLAVLDPVGKKGYFFTDLKLDQPIGLVNAETNQVGKGLGLKDPVYCWLEIQSKSN